MPEKIESEKTEPESIESEQKSRQKLAPEYRPKIKSFALRCGRMTGGQAAAYESMLPKYGVDFMRWWIYPAKVASLDGRKKSAKQK